jgi:hypothetical protein
MSQVQMLDLFSSAACGWSVSTFGEEWKNNQPKNTPRTTKRPYRTNFFKNIFFIIVELLNFRKGH